MSQIGDLGAGEASSLTLLTTGYVIQKTCSCPCCLLINAVSYRFHLVRENQTAGQRFSFSDQLPQLRAFRWQKCGQHHDMALPKYPVSPIPSLVLRGAQTPPSSEVPKEASHKCFCLFIPLLPEMGTKTDPVQSKRNQRVNGKKRSQW